MHTCNLNALDVEVGRSGVQVQPWLHSEFEPGWDTWNLSQRETGTQTSRRKDQNIHISIARVQSSAFSILGTISSLIVEEPSGLNCYREQLDEAAFQRVPGLPHNDKTVQRVLLVGGTGYKRKAILHIRLSASPIIHPNTSSLPPSSNFPIHPLITSNTHTCNSISYRSTLHCLTNDLWWLCFWFRMYEFALCVASKVKEEIVRLEQLLSS